jgi:hypothetical protein
MQALAERKNANAKTLCRRKNLRLNETKQPLTALKSKNIFKGVYFLFGL